MSRQIIKVTIPEFEVIADTSDRETIKEAIYAHLQDQLDLEELEYSVEMEEDEEEDL